MCRSTNLSANLVRCSGFIPTSRIAIYIAKITRTYRNAIPTRKASYKAGMSSTMCFPRFFPASHPTLSVSLKLPYFFSLLFYRSAFTLVFLLFLRCFTYLLRLSSPYRTYASNKTLYFLFRWIFSRESVKETNSKNVSVQILLFIGVFQFCHSNFIWVIFLLTTSNIVRQ